MGCCAPVLMQSAGRPGVQPGIGGETRIVDLAEMINAATGNKAGIRFAEKRKWDTKSRLLASVDKRQSLHRVPAQDHFAVGLAKTIGWFRVIGPTSGLQLASARVSVSRERDGIAVVMKTYLPFLAHDPEAIKLVPVSSQSSARIPHKFRSLVCVTAQHREMLDQVLEFFSSPPITTWRHARRPEPARPATALLGGLRGSSPGGQPDLVARAGRHDHRHDGRAGCLLSQNPGRTRRSRPAHRDRYSPFPEEINRRITGVLATLHFAPTERAAAALRSEQVPAKNVFVTGNTVVDALYMTSRVARYNWIWVLTWTAGA